MEKEKVDIGSRLMSMFVDHFVLLFVLPFIMMPGIIFTLLFSDMSTPGHDPESPIPIGVMFFILLGFSIYFNKDVFSSRSAGKRTVKMRVVNNKTGKAASAIRCLIRNLTLLMLPIEFVMTFVNPKRRLGDMLAGTRIDNFYPSKDKVETAPKRKFAFLLVIGFPLIMLPIGLMISSQGWQEDKVNYIESSYDQQASELANETFVRKLDGLIKEADFKIYNQIDLDDRVYVSAILYLSDGNFVEDEAIEAKIMKLMDSEFSLERHICFFKYVEKGGIGYSTVQRLYDARRY